MGFMMQIRPEVLKKLREDYSTYLFSPHNRCYVELYIKLTGSNESSETQGRSRSHWAAFLNEWRERK